MVDDNYIARRQVQARKAKELCFIALTPGNIVTARICGGRYSRFIFTHFSETGNVLGVRACVAPIDIISINDQRTHYIRLPVSDEEMQAELTAIRDRRAKAGPLLRGYATGPVRRGKKVVPF